MPWMLFSRPIWPLQSTTRLIGELPDKVKPAPIAA